MSEETDMDKTTKGMFPLERKFQILGTYITSFTYRWVWNEYPFGNNHVIFWTVSTYVAVMISWYPKIVIVLGMVGAPIPLVHFVQKSCGGQLL